MPFARAFLCSLFLPALAACTTTAGPMPGTAEFAAVKVSRGYDCGVAVDRRRVMAGLAPAERGRFVAVNASLAVKSYKAPRHCDAAERSAVQSDLARLTRR